MPRSIRETGAAAISIGVESDAAGVVDDRTTARRTEGVRGACRSPGGTCGGSGAATGSTLPASSWSSSGACHGSKPRCSASTPSTLPSIMIVGGSRFSSLREQEARAERARRQRGFVRRRAIGRARAVVSELPLRWRSTLRVRARADLAVCAQGLAFDEQRRREYRNAEGGAGCRRRRCSIRTSQRARRPEAPGRSRSLDRRPYAAKS